MKGEKLAEAQDIPLQFLEHILLEMKHAGIIQARRGARGGYWLAQPPEKTTVADVIRAVEGPLANIHESAPEDLHYGGPAERLRDVWVAIRANLSARARGGHPGGRDLRAPALADRGDAEQPGGLDQALKRARALRPSSATLQAPFDPAGRQRPKRAFHISIGSRNRHRRPWHRPARRHDRHGRRVVDDAAPDPGLRRGARDRDRHRHLLWRDHEDRRRLAAPEAGARSTGPRLLARRRQRPLGDRRRVRHRGAAALVGEDRLDQLVSAWSGERCSSSALRRWLASFSCAA